MKRYRTYLNVFFCMTILSLTANAIEVFEFRSEEERKQFQELAEQLRCPVCQNQSLADSGAGLADDLRAEIFNQVQEKKDNDEIIQFMVDRYGDFIIYRPRFNAVNLLLWGGPILFLLLGLGFLLHHIRHQRHSNITDESLNNDELQRLDKLLKKDSPDT